MEESKNKKTLSKNQRIFFIVFSIICLIVTIWIVYVVFIGFSRLDSPCIHSIIFEENVNGNVVELRVIGYDQHGDTYPELYSTSNYEIRLNYDNESARFSLNKTNFYHWSNSTWFSYDDVNNNQLLDGNDIFLLSSAGKTMELFVLYKPYDIGFLTYSWTPATP